MIRAQVGPSMGKLPPGSLPARAPGRRTPVLPSAGGSASSPATNSSIARTNSGPMPSACGSAASTKRPLPWSSFSLPRLMPAPASAPAKASIIRLSRKPLCPSAAPPSGRSDALRGVSKKPPGSVVVLPARSISQPSGTASPWFAAILILPRATTEVEMSITSGGLPGARGMPQAKGLVLRKGAALPKGATQAPPPASFTRRSVMRPARAGAPT